MRAPSSLLVPSSALVGLVLAGLAAAPYAAPTVAPPVPGAPAQIELEKVDRVPQLPLAVRYQSLFQQYEIAYGRWRKQLDAADEAAREALQAADPTPAFIAPFEELARAGSGQAKLFLLEHYDAAGRSAAETRERRTALLEELCLNHAQEPWISQLAGVVRDAWSACDQDRASSSLLALVYQTSDGETRRRIGMELATCLAFQGRGDEDAAAAKSLFEELMRDEPDATFRRLVQGRLFRLENLRVGMPVPELVGTDADGIDLDLADFRERVVVIDFWGSWCRPCREELPRLKVLTERYPDDFTVFGVNMGDSPDAFRAQAERSGITWPNVLTGDEAAIPIAWGIDEYPTTFVLDRDGTIRATGAHGEELERLVAELVAARE